MEQRNSTKRVLLVDPNVEERRTLKSELETFSLRCEEVSSAEDALVVLRARAFDAAVLEHRLTGMDGIEFCRRSGQIQPGLPVVLMTKNGDFEVAIAALRAKVSDFFNKPVDAREVALAIERAVTDQRLQTHVQRLDESVSAAPYLDDLIGSSYVMQQVFQLVEGAANSDATVLITGESGTGKELVARALHRLSRRRNGPFVAVNCAAMPDTLLESELFGHAKGAFTDAKSERNGLFVQANRGTILLDEIGEMPLGMQAKILRVLQERVVRPIGSNHEVAFDARIVAATNRDLDREVYEGRFREDLFFRVNVISIGLPPLRARGNDVLLLAQHLLERSAMVARKPVTGISSGAAERLLYYSWPGNVRELQNAMERAVALTRFEQITAEDLPEKVRYDSSEQRFHESPDVTELIPLEEVERRHILRVLESTKGNRALAARVLGLDRKTLYRKLGRWNAAE